MALKWWHEGAEMIMNELLICWQTHLTVNLFCITNLIPFSVNRDGSNLRTLPSKNDLLISGSRSGSSPINCKPKTMKYVKRECVFEKMTRLGNREFWNSYELIF